MATREYDKKFTTLTEEALHNILEYTRYSKEINCIYLYISLEGSPISLAFFRINGHISFQHKLNDFSIKDNFDISKENQTTLNSKGNEIASKIKKAFIEDNREVPTYLKIICEPQNGIFECKIGYEKLLDYDNMINEITVHFRWYKELGGILTNWQEKILK